MKYNATFTFFCTHPPPSLSCPVANLNNFDKSQPRPPTAHLQICYMHDIARQRSSIILNPTTHAFRRQEQEKQARFSFPSGIRREGRGMGEGGRKGQGRDQDVKCLLPLLTTEIPSLLHSSIRNNNDNNQENNADARKKKG